LVLYQDTSTYINKKIAKNSKILSFISILFKKIAKNSKIITYTSINQTKINLVPHPLTNSVGGCHYFVVLVRLTAVLAVYKIQCYFV